MENKTKNKARCTIWSLALICASVYLFYAGLTQDNVWLYIFAFLISISCFALGILVLISVYKKNLS